MNEDTAKLAAEGSLAASAEPHSGSPAAASFPAEAFPCPHCGQMLGPSVRVCAACRERIDPVQIRLPAVSAAAPAAHAAAQKAAERPRNTPFPWVAVGLLLLSTMFVVAAAEKRFGIPATVHGSRIAFGFLQLATSLWVIFDAYRKRIPQPLIWGVGTMLLWIVVFPWYLARRRKPSTVCPLIESGARSLLWIVLLSILISIVGMMFLGPMLNSLPK
jgi:hypothetical protein